MRNIGYVLIVWEKILLGKETILELLTKSPLYDLLHPLITNHTSETKSSSVYVRSN